METAAIALGIACLGVYIVWLVVYRASSGKWSILPDLSDEEGWPAFWVVIILVLSIGPFVLFGGLLGGFEGIVVGLLTWLIAAVILAFFIFLLLISQS